MALNWNIENIKNYKKVCWNKEKINPITDTLIWGCLIVDIGAITDKNWKDFYLRIHLSELWGGSYLTNEKGAYYITKKDVFNHIGLSTNVGTQSRSKWLNKFFKNKEKSLTLN